MKQKSKGGKKHIILLFFFILFTLLILISVSFIYWVNGIVKSKAFADYAAKIVEKYTAISGQFEPFSFYGFGLETQGYKGKGSKESPVELISIHPIAVQLSSLGIWGRPWIVRSIELGNLSIDLQTPELPAERKTEKIPLASPYSNKEEAVLLEKIQVRSLDLKWPTSMGGGGEIKDIELNIVSQKEKWLINGNKGLLLLKSFPELAIEEIKAFLDRTSIDLSKGKLHLNGFPKSLVTTEGTIGLLPTQNTHIDLSLNQIPLEAVLNEPLRNELKGNLRGTIGINASHDIMKTYHGEGELYIDQGRLVHVPFLTNLDSFLKLNRLEDIPLSVARNAVTLEPNTIKLHNIDWQSEDTMKMTGWITLVGQKVSGILMLGIRADWIPRLPGLGGKLFNPGEGGYFWTEIHLSGTLNDLHEDFSPRLNNAVQGILQKGIEKEIQRQVPGRIFKNILPNFP
ncbi:hypothetical protein [Methylacidiphilum caldifontis]|uniref:AsmA-like C-terminal domain-containing protein n=1 Tax=Methylacidiphilum caldifontis TaxID=2795386 RepID=A0A4Y8PGZ7_9BACT|nr:hypothetical protein [Methylacidiphilum caldifontis]TFE72520.1 hypothetical protein A7Q10_03675 [Methylacidiphilum caldifontis]